MSTGRRLGALALAATLAAGGAVLALAQPAAANDPNPTGVLTPIGSVVNQRTITVQPSGTNHAYTIKFQYGDLLPNGYREVFFTVSVGIRAGANAGSISDAFSFAATEPLRATEAAGATVDAFLTVNAHASVTGTLNVNRLIEAAATGNADNVLVVSANIRVPNLAGAKVNFNAGFSNGNFVVQRPSASFSVASPAYTAGAGVNANATFRVELPDGAARRLFTPTWFSSFGGMGSDDFKRLPGAPPTGGDLLKSAKNGTSGKQANPYLFDESSNDQVAGYPVFGDYSTFLGDLESPVYLFDTSVQLPEYRYEDSLPLGLLDKGVNFQSIEFTGLTLDDDSGSPFFRADLTPAPAGSAGLSREELIARQDRFKQYFLEGMALLQDDLRVSVEAHPDANGNRQARVVLPNTLRTTSAARVMVDSDITMKRDYLADVVRGDEATVNDGVLGIWYDELAKSPDYGRILADGGGVPGFNADVRAVIVGDRVQVERGQDHYGGDDTYRIVSAPLNLQTFLDTCQMSAGASFEPFRAELETIQQRTCDRITQRMAERKPAFVTKLNTAPEYAELRLVYNGFAQSLLYKVLAQDLPNSPYAGFANTGQLPADLLPAGEFPESEYVARATTTAGTERATAPCGTYNGQTLCPAGEATIQVFGGVDWVTFAGNQNDLDNAQSWFRSAVPTLGVGNKDGVRSVNLGTALAGGLPEYVVSAEGDPRTSFSVTMRNLGNAAPIQRYLLLQDVATNAEGEVLRNKSILHHVSADVLVPGGWEKLDVTCTACLEDVPGATRRWIQATVYLGQLADTTFTLQPEFNPYNSVSLVYQGDAAGAPAATAPANSAKPLDKPSGTATAARGAGASITRATGTDGTEVVSGAAPTLRPVPTELDRVPRIRLG